MKDLIYETFILIFFGLLYCLNMGFAICYYDIFQASFNMYASIFFIIWLVPIKNKKNKKTLFITISLYLIINMLYAFIIPIIYSDFSKEKWNEHPLEREYMLDSFKMNYDVIGESEEFIIDLLGEPDKKLNTPRTVVYKYYIHVAFVLEELPSINIVIEDGIAVDFYSEGFR